jgi:1-deoxy-D-xylulose-5-phosphate reductoisomerase
MGGAASAILNAANEIAVEAFLNERVRFGHIFQIVEKTLEDLAGANAVVPSSLKELLEVDQAARRFAADYCGKLAS